MLRVIAAFVVVACGMMLVESQADNCLPVAGAPSGFNLNAVPQRTFTLANGDSICVSLCTSNQCHSTSPTVCHPTQAAYVTVLPAVTSLPCGSAACCSTDTVGYYTTADYWIWTSTGHPQARFSTPYPTTHTKLVLNLFCGSSPIELLSAQKGSQPGDYTTLSLESSAACNSSFGTNAPPGPTAVPDIPLPAPQDHYSKGSHLVVIIGASAGGVVFLLLIVIIVIILKRRPADVNLMADGPDRVELEGLTNTKRRKKGKAGKKGKRSSMDPDDEQERVREEDDVDGRSGPSSFGSGNGSGASADDDEITPDQIEL